jgi:hypothetical protein
MIDDLDRARAARARKLRRLGALGLALAALTLLAPFAAAAEPAGWSVEARAELYVACREQLDDHRFCDCAVDALAAITPSPAAVTAPDVDAAFEACPKPLPKSRRTDRLDI